MVRGVTLLDGADGGLLPLLFSATTVNVYAVPFTRLFTVHVNGPCDHTHVCPPGEAVAVYLVTGCVGLAGASHKTSIC